MRKVQFKPDNSAVKVSVRVRCGSRTGYGIHGVDFRYDESNGEFKSDSDLGIEIPVAAKPDWRIDHPDLTEEHKCRIISVLDDEFELAPKTLGKTNALVNKLKLVDPSLEPVKVRQYPLLHTSWAKINKTVDEWLESGICKPSESAWSSPVLLVQQSGKKDRVVIDFRAVNQRLENDAYPQTHMNTILTSIVNPRFISKFDLKSAFLQIPLTSDSGPLTASRGGDSLSSLRRRSDSKPVVRL